jgi:hypothetical protein
MEERFSVWQFSTSEFGNIQEKVRELVSAEEAMGAFGYYTNNVATTIGATARVIITDGGDSVVAEWKKDEGYTFPPELVAEAKKAGLQK